MGIECMGKQQYCLFVQKEIPKILILPRTFPFLILLDHESGRNNLKHVGQIISAEVSFPSNATADAFFCYPNLDAGLKDC
ncbi:hypothetical protein T4C_3219 [Trichinella pseudospiralis]|uniref:Uncharacterized protein n=1 Tax=Trichinella pseudospiralis TaxID=6337 RepID=A0A0V1JZS5_TRIPS|nr:hypothetical protein T4C_3219 [Trichinella pseudospiralis]